MGLGQKLRDFENENFEQTFARTKKVSDFVAFLSRLAILALLIGIVNAKLETANSALVYWNYWLAWLSLTMLTVVLGYLVFQCVMKFAVDLAFEAVRPYRGLKAVAFAVVMALVIFPICIGMIQLGGLAQSWGKDQSTKMLQSSDPATMPAKKQ